MTVDHGDEKYAKAAKQSQQGLIGIAVIVCFLVASSIVFYSNNNSSSNSKDSLRNLKVEDPTRNYQIHEPNVQELETSVKQLDAAVRVIKEKVDIFETDPIAQVAAKNLQDETRKLLHKRYGLAEPYRVVVELEFQKTIIDFGQKGKDGGFVIELAPSSLQPHSINTFLEVARHWQGGAFHRIAHHVLQVMVKTHTIKHLAFQEYSPEYPHKKGTVGYAGRPSGPAFYVSIQDNSKNHGPGSQQKHNPYEADSCFGTIIDGWDSVMRITKVQGDGFLGDAKKHVLIKSMTIQVPIEAGSDVYEVWHE